MTQRTLARIEKFHGLRRTLTFSLAWTLVVLATIGTSARAEQELWYGTFSSDWWTAGNWLGIGIPEPTDTVFFGSHSHILRATVNLDADATILGLNTSYHPPDMEYVFQRTNNSVLTVTGSSEFDNLASGIPNAVTLNGFHLNTSNLSVQGFTRLNVQNNARVVFTNILAIDPAAELSVTTGTLEMGFESRAEISGKLSIGQNTTLGQRTLIRALAPTSLVSINNGFNFNNASEVLIANGADVVGNGYIDIGNTGSSTVSIKGAGSKWTAGGTSDWGRTPTGNATVKLENGGEATLFNLRMGEDGGTSSVTVTGGAYLTVNGAFTAGGTTADRTVLLNAGNPALFGNENFVTFNGTSTFNNKSVLDSDLNSTISFNQNATFNEGSRFERVFGSTLNIASGKKLIFNEGVYQDSNTGGQKLSAGAGIEVRGTLARFNVADYFDIGAGSLLVELNAQVNSPSGATITDWGSAPLDVMTADIRTGGRVNIGDLRIADAGTASVTIASGGQLNPRHLTTGGKPGASATLFFDGGQATISGNANLGQGTLFTISDPVGAFSAQTGNVGIFGDLNLTGNAQLATVGVDPGLNILGNLNTATGTQIQTGGNTFFGVGQSATLNGGTVSLFGASKMNVTEDLTLGVVDGGAGSLTINPGTRLNVGDTAAAIVDNSYSYVEDSSSNATGGGTIFVRNGATLTNSNSGFSVGENPGNSGRIVVSGAGSTVNDTTTYFGWAGSGRLSVEGGGRFDSDQMLLGAAGGSAYTSVDGLGSELDVANGIDVGTDGSGEGSWLQLINGGKVTATQVNVGGNSVLSLSGMSEIDSNLDIRGELSVYDSSITGGVTLQAESTIQADNATVESLEQQAGADLLVALRGASDFDNLAVTAEANLAGNVIVSLAEGFVPTAGTEFEILTAGSLGTLPNVDLTAASLPGGLTWGVGVGPTSLFLIVISIGTPGDYNGDGLVNLADYTVWRDNLGASITLPNDSTPGSVTSDDYTMWKSNFGATSAAGAVARQAVPEPAAGVLLAVGFLLLALSWGTPKH